jgi:hypothetical protein
VPSQAFLAVALAETVWLRPKNGRNAGKVFVTVTRTLVR